MQRAADRAAREVAIHLAIRAFDQRVLIFVFGDLGEERRLQLRIAEIGLLGDHMIS
jgi:hypothetical protein